MAKAKIYRRTVTIVKADSKTYRLDVKSHGRHPIDRAFWYLFFGKTQLRFLLRVIGVDPEAKKFYLYVSVGRFKGAVSWDRYFGFLDHAILPNHSKWVEGNMYAKPCVSFWMDVMNRRYVPAMLWVRGRAIE